MVNESKWLKKYTQIKYLNGILKNCTLHLGDPSSWEDKNDKALIEIYKTRKGLDDVRVTCLTSAPDRYHFWEIFGRKEEGVCLWFDKNELLKNIDNIDCCRAQNVRYGFPNMVRKSDIDKLPFLKRAQYSDEREFRILAETNDGPPLTTFKFSPSSLKRIYFNSWLSPVEYEIEKALVKKIISDQLSKVEIKRSRLTNYEPWIDAAKEVADSR